MNQIKRILKEHRLAIGLALLTSLLVSFPQISFRVDRQDINRGIELLPDSPWSARVREVQDGHSNFGSIYYKEGKTDPYLFQPLGSAVVGYLGMALSLNINNTILLSRLVFPFIVSLLLYGFVFVFSRDKLAALSSSAALLLADSVLSYSGIARLFHGISPDNFLRLSRPVNPAMVYVFLFSFLISFWFFYREKKWKYGVLSSLLLGLNFYNYFYSWTFIYAFGAVLTLIFLVQRNWRGAARITTVFLGALIVAIPYVWNLYSATLYPTYEEVSTRFGVIASHAPLLVGSSVIVVFIIFLLCFTRSDKEKYFFGLALILAPFVTTNQQILTGKVLQADHYHWFFHKPVALILVVVVAFDFLFRHRKILQRKVLAAVVVVASISVGVFVQAHSYANDGRDGGIIAVERQRYGQVMDWLNQNSKESAVVLANDEISHMTVIYTPLNVFYHRAAIYSLAASKERLLDTLFTFYRLRGVNASTAHDTIFAERSHVSSSIYGMHYRELFGSYEAIPDSKVNEVVALYKETLTIPTSEWFDRVLAKYEVNYLVWDRKNDPLWVLDQYDSIVKAAEFDDLIIFHRP